MQRCKDVISRMPSATLRHFTEKVVILDSRRQESVQSGGTIKTILSILDDNTPTTAVQQQ